MFEQKEQNNLADKLQLEIDKLTKERDTTLKQAIVDAMKQSDAALIESWQNALRERVRNIPVDELLRAPITGR